MEVPCIGCLLLVSILKNVPYFIFLWLSFHFSILEKSLCFAMKYFTSSHSKFLKVFQLSPAIVSVSIYRFHNARSYMCNNWKLNTWNLTFPHHHSLLYPPCSCVLQYTILWLFLKMLMLKVKAGWTRIRILEISHQTQMAVCWRRIELASILNW